MPLHPQATEVLAAMEEDGFRLSPEMTPTEMRGYTIQTQQDGALAEVGRVADRVIPGPGGGDLPIRIFWPHGAGEGGRLPGWWCSSTAAAGCSAASRPTSRRCGPW